MNWLYRLGLLKEPVALRSELEQKQVDDACRQLQLFNLTTCPHCYRVRRVIRQLQLNIVINDVNRSRDHLEELVSKGGMFQVPCLRIQQAGKITYLYESSDIISYLNEHFKHSVQHN